jgi:hypothetical protein
MSSFEDDVAAWRACPFPPGSRDDSIDELHADLVLADTWVAETVIPYLTSGIYVPAKVDVIRELRKLRRRALELSRRSTHQEERGLTDSYRYYIDLLRRVYQGFTEHRP